MTKIKMALLLLVLMSCSWGQLSKPELDSERLKNAIAELDTMSEQHVLVLVTDIGGSDTSVDVIDGYPSKIACDSSGPYFVRKIEIGLKNVSKKSNGGKGVVVVNVDFMCLHKFPALAGVETD